jgi:DNA-binding transcriptional ArsR family regulator
MGTDDPPPLDEIEPFESDDLPDDVNAAAEQEWKATTTGFERVEAILRRTTSLQSAKEIADRALVSEPTARKHLETLVTSGHASTKEMGNKTLYRRNPDQQRLERIQHLADEHTMAELEASIRDMKKRIQSFEIEYDATGPEEVVQELDPDDDRGWDDVSRWKTTRHSLAFAKTALSFKETRNIDMMSTEQEVVGETNA